MTRLKVGDHVVATLIRNCGFCPACTEGAPVFCEEVFPLDRATPLHDGAGKPIVHGLRTGAFAEHMVVDQSQAIAIPKDMALDSAALIACGVLTGMGAVINTAGVKAGSSVVVIGCGGVGLNSIQGARIAGCFPDHRRMRCSAARFTSGCALTPISIRTSPARTRIPTAPSIRTRTPQRHARSNICAKASPR